MTSITKGCKRSCNLEEKLDEDFLFYLAHTKWCLTKVPEKWRKQAGKWLKCLLSRTPQTVEKKKERNLHLSTLLLEMVLGELRGMYAESEPPKADEPLPRYSTDIEPQEAPATVSQKRDEHLPIPEWVTKIIEEEKPSEEVKEPQINHKSNDGRIYLATKAFAKRPGAYGFLSMSTERAANGMSLRNGKMSGDQDEMLRSRQLGRHKTKGHATGSCAGDMQSTASLHMSRRKPPEAREALSRIYDNLLSQIERAMIGERIVRVERLLQRMWQDLSMDPAYDYLHELPPHALRDELLRTLLDTIIIKRGRLARREEFLRRMETKITGSMEGYGPKKPPCGFGSRKEPSVKRSPQLNQGAWQTPSGEVGHSPLE
jgi:hypothetical protein